MNFKVYFALIFFFVVNLDTSWFLCGPCFPKSLITEASDPLPPESANLLICSRPAQHRAARPILLPMGTCPGILLPFSFLLFHVPRPVGWSETLRAVYHDGKNTGSGVNQTWHKILPLPLLATWPWENLTSDNFLTSPNLSFCFCKMRIKSVLRVVVKNKRDEKCWVCNPEWGKPRRQLMWLGGKG